MKVCKRCHTAERGYEARYSWTTRRFEPSLGPSSSGRFCAPCAKEVAQEKNVERLTTRRAGHGEVRHLVKDGKSIA
jgi:hypothetical protein